MNLARIVRLKKMGNEFVGMVVFRDGIDNIIRDLKDIEQANKFYNDFINQKNVRMISIRRF